MSLGKIPNEITIQFFLNVVCHLLCVYLSFLMEQSIIVQWFFSSFPPSSPQFPNYHISVSTALGDLLSKQKYFPNKDSNERLVYH